MSMRHHILRSGWVLIPILVAGLFLRLYRRGQASLQIDNLMFWDTLQRDLPVGRIFGEWTEIFGLTGQLPTAMAMMKAFVDLFRLTPSFDTMLLPFGIVGALAIPVAYALGAELRDRQHGLLLATLTAFSPMALQMSREAYFYAPTFLGGFLGLWTMALTQRVWRNKALPPYFHILNAAAFFMLSWFSPSAWPFAFFWVIYMVGLFGYRVIRHKRSPVDLIIMIAVYAVIGLPLLLAPWGLQHIMEFTSDGETRAYWVRVFEVGRGESTWAKLWPTFAAYGWGTTGLRQSFLMLVLLGGLVAIYRSWRYQPAFLAMLILFFVVLVLNLLALERSVWFFGTTRIVVLAPFFLLLLSIGLLYPYDALQRHRFRLLGVVLPIGALLLWVEPVRLVPMMTGKPRPFQAISDWADAHLPAGTPIVTDRFFTAYNEFRVHAPAHVIFLSIVPNQIPEQYNGNQFRARTLDFFNRHADAAWLEEQHQWKHPEIGPWTAVRDRFAQSHTVWDAAGYRLAQLGLSYRGDPSRAPELTDYGATIWYNTTADLLERTRQAGGDAMVLFTAGWNTVSTGDGRQWRLMESAAEITCWNLSGQEQPFFIEIVGVAAGSSKRVTVSGGGTFSFPRDQIATWQIGPVMLPVGQTSLQLFDAMQNRPVPLLVYSLTIRS